MNATKAITILSYAWNGCNWEWDGCGWDAETFTTEGDFSAYGEGERIRLVGFDESGEVIAEAESVIHNGQFVS